MGPPLPPREAGRERISIRCVGVPTGLAASFTADVEEEPDLVVEAVESPAAVADRVPADGPGPDCVVVTDDGDLDPLAVARQFSESDPDLPVVLYVGDPDAYGARAVLEAGVTALFEPGEETIPESLREVASTYRRRLDARRDSAVLSSLFERLPVSLFVKSAEGEYVRASESAPDPTDAESDRRVLEDGETVDGETVYSPADQRWYLVSKAPVYEGGDPAGLVGIAVDITARRERERLLQSTSRLLRAIVQASPVPIVVHDRDGTVRVWNEAAENLFGWGADEVIGAEYPPFVPEADRSAFEKLCERTLSEGIVSDVDVQWATRDGTERDLRLSAATVEPCDGDQCIVSILSDVTAMRERERRLERQHERVETFATVLAHDLRNPVQVLRGQIGTGVDGETDPAMAERALDRVEAIVDDVLALARESPIVDDPTPVSIAAVAREAWPDADDGSLTVAADAEVCADPLRLRRLLAQLFDNSLEHADGPVAVRVEPLPDGFAVADDGPGIDEADRAHVRDPGYTTKPGGTGYGLNVVAEIAAAHGWAVSIVESEPGGTRVEVTGVEFAGS